MAKARQNPPFGADIISSLEKGVNTRQVEWKIDPSAAVDLLNVDQSKNGVFGRRKGATPFGGIEAEPGGLGQFRDNATDQQNAWAVFGSELFLSTGSGLWETKACGISLVSDRLHMFVEGNWSAASGDQRSMYVSQAAPSSGVTEASMLMAFKGLNAADFSQSASYAPLAIAYFQNRLWIANNQVAGDGNDLAWSELDDGLTYSPANALSIEPGIGGRITALLPARDSTPKLWIFKEDAITLLSPQWGSSGSLIPGIGDELDTITSSLRMLTAGVGCVATRSVVWVPGFEKADVFFLARDGVRSLQRAENDTQIGAGLPLTYNVPAWVDRINFDFAHKAVATVFDNAYHLAVPMDGATDNTHVLRFDLFQQSWSLHNWKWRDASIIPFSNEQRLFFQHMDGTNDCSATGAPDSLPHQVYRAYVGAEDPGGVPVSYKIETRAFSFGDVNIRKRWDELAFIATVPAGETHFPTIVYRSDFRDWTTAASLAISVPDVPIILGQDPLPWVAPDQQLIARRIGLQDVDPGRMIQFRILGESDYALPSFYELRVKAEAEQEIHDNEIG